MENDVSDYYCKDVSLVEKYSGKVFSNKLRHIYIELPRFLKSESECESIFECWIYNLVNMNKLKEMSFKDRKAIFDKLERLASQSNLSEDERWRLEEDWKNYNDFFNTYDFAKEEGRAEGLEKGRAEGIAEGHEKGIAEGEQRKNLENARNFKALGVSVDTIMKATGLSIEEIEKL